MIKSHPPDSNQVTKMCSRTTLIEKQLKELCDEEVDVNKYFSIEIDYIILLQIIK